MNSSSQFKVQAVAVAMAALLAHWRPAAAQVNVNPAIRRGVDYLKAETPKDNQIGQQALATLALLKAGEKPTDPVIAPLVAKIHAAALQDDFVKAHRVYDGAVILMALAAADPTQYFSAIQRVAEQLMARQLPGGCWSYVSGPLDGDTSQTQYVILALWEAASVGIHIPVEIWDKAILWHLATQDQGGGFAYHPRISPDGKRLAQSGGQTHTMSIAALGSMIICKSQVPFFDRKRSIRDQELLIPVEETEAQYKPQAVREQVDNAIAAGEQWMVANLTFSDPKGLSVFYYLYGVERYGSLAEKQKIGTADWYQSGAQYILSQQQADGSWRKNYAPTVDTSFALLFLGRSTEKTLQRMRITRLGKGTLIGGRGVPSEDSAMSGALARRKSRYRAALKTPVEDLLKIINDPEAAESETKKAAATIETAPDETVVKAAAGNMAMLRRLTRDPRPGVRSAALAALARTRDLRVVPLLINGLSDPEANVYVAARDGLIWVSRRIDGFGLSERQPIDSKVIDAGVAKWKAWFASLDVPLEPTQRFDEP